MKQNHIISTLFLLITLFWSQNILAEEETADVHCTVYSESGNPAQLIDNTYHAIGNATITLEIVYPNSNYGTINDIQINGQSQRLNDTQSFEIHAKEGKNTIAVVVYYSTSSQEQKESTWTKDVNIVIHKSPYINNLNEKAHVNAFDNFPISLSVQEPEDEASISWEYNWICEDKKIPGSEIDTTFNAEIKHNKELILNCICKYNSQEIDRIEKKITVTVYPTPTATIPEKYKAVVIGEARNFVPECSEFPEGGEWIIKWNGEETNSPDYRYEYTAKEGDSGVTLYYEFIYNDDFVNNYSNSHEDHKDLQVFAAIEWPQTPDPISLFHQEKKPLEAKKPDGGSEDWNYTWLINNHVMHSGKDYTILANNYNEWNLKKVVYTLRYENIYDGDTIATKDQNYTIIEYPIPHATIVSTADVENADKKPSDATYVGGYSITCAAKCSDTPNPEGWHLSWDNGQNYQIPRSITPETASEIKEVTLQGSYTLNEVNKGQVEDKKIITIFSSTELDTEKQDEVMFVNKEKDLTAFEPKEKDHQPTWKYEWKDADGNSISSPSNDRMLPYTPTNSGIKILKVRYSTEYEGKEMWSEERPTATITVYDQPTPTLSPVREGYEDAAEIIQSLIVGDELTLSVSINDENKNAIKREISWYVDDEIINHSEKSYTYSTASDSAPIDDCTPHYIKVKVKDTIIDSTEDCENSDKYEFFVFPKPQIKLVSGSNSISICGGDKDPVSIMINRVGGINDKDKWHTSFYKKEDSNKEPILLSDYNDKYDFSERINNDGQTEHFLQYIINAECKSDLRWHEADSITIDVTVYPNPSPSKEISVVDILRNYDLANSENKSVRKGNPLKFEVNVASKGGAGDSWDYIWTLFQPTNDTIVKTHDLSYDNYVIPVNNSDTKNSEQYNYKYYTYYEYNGKLYDAFAISELAFRAYNRPKNPVKIAKKGNGTSGTWIVSTNGSIDTAQGDYIVIGYTDQDGIDHGKEVFDLFNGNSNTTYYTDKELSGKKVWTYVVWQYNNGVKITSDKIVYNENNDGDICLFDGSQYGNTRSDNSDCDGIETVITDSFNGPLKVYNMNGAQIADDTNSLSPGLYIIKNGKMTKKIIIK